MLVLMSHLADFLCIFSSTILESPSFIPCIQVRIMPLPSPTFFACCEIKIAVTTKKADMAFFDSSWRFIKLTLTLGLQLRSEITQKLI